MLWFKLIELLKPLNKSRAHGQYDDVFDPLSYEYTRFIVVEESVGVTRVWGREYANTVPDNTCL